MPPLAEAGAQCVVRAHATELTVCPHQANSHSIPMRLPACLLCFLLGAFSPLYAQSRAGLTSAQWDRIGVAPMKTSIYVGSIKLTTGVLERQGSSFSTTYEAKVLPWFFWSESGRITINLSDAEFANLAQGHTAQFTGDAVNQKDKPRKVTGRAQPADATSGKIKVRVMADGIELIFNGTYHLGS